MRLYIEHLLKVTGINNRLTVILRSMYVVNEPPYIMESICILYQIRMRDKHKSQIPISGFYTAVVII